MPYITAGYPDLDTTAKLLQRLDHAGCQGIEVGFPFSDSIADGPVIQDSFYRALENGFQVDDLFKTIASIRSKVSAGLLAMVSMSIVRRWGIEDFARKAAEAGFDGLIVPDVPVDECDSLAAIASEAGLCNVLMVAPTTSDARCAEIAAKGSGFIYVIASKGITGERTSVADDLASNVAKMRAQTTLPLIVGFGINTPEHVAKVCEEADGAIVGSAIIRRMTESVVAGQTSDELVDSIGQYVDELIAATR